MTARRQLVVIGAGGFGREVLDVIQSVNAAASRPAFEVLGVADDSPSADNVSRLHRRGVPHLGRIDDLLAVLGRVADFVVAIGDPSTRADVESMVTETGRESPVLIHPTAGIGSEARFGAGVVVCAGVQVSTNVILGRSVHLNPNATIGHDAVVGDHVSVNPGAVISGDCRVGERTLVGAGAVVLQGVSVGTGARVGAAACVTRDVPAGLTVKGVPAR